MAVSDPTIKTKPAVDETGRKSSRVLQTRDLRKEFGGLTATDDVDFALEEGELRCLIGPNGAGKSTFLNLLTGQLEPTAGSIYYDGHDITAMPSHERVERGISMKFQVPSIYEGLTVAQNLRVPLQQVVDDDFAVRTREILERFDLLAERETTASDLSHGQQQRLEIGMAMALEPKLLLLDEPVAGLSVEETAEIADLLCEIAADDGVALIVIEHDIDFVESIADRVTVLDQGTIFREGSIEEIKADPEVKRIYLGEDH
ncbi:ABC transporter ATP-binding protein [Natronolimnohabitans sp. A-GB9]|uniref:ABC transporter ATP-binding protein n=1 Tax=Natronolimnohabitans sp. A-GB9 TaxID=3069757 RepID=UPI0027B36650|nr:ABC transporter ATP-binding protein [Natronolimnohabitans sp. A-GB9]MDQ2049074.1 ABC transporter ATP-binding protein [Natronolimnohabitans sp. A-GB9]